MVAYKRFETGLREAMRRKVCVAPLYSFMREQADSLFLEICGKYDIMCVKPDVKK